MYRYLCRGGGAFYPTKPCQDAEGTCVSQSDLGTFIAIRKGTFIWKTLDVNLFYLHTYTHLC